MAHDKLNEADDGFLDLPEKAMRLSSGVNGVETWIERDTTTTVRIVISTVAVATHGTATLEAVIETEGGTAKAEDGPLPADNHHDHLQAEVSIQAVVKAGERLKFKAYPNAQGARVLRTQVYATDLRKDG